MTPPPLQCEFAGCDLAARWRMTDYVGIHKVCGAHFKTEHGVILHGAPLEAEVKLKEIADEVNMWRRLAGLPIPKYDNTDQEKK